MSSELPPCFVIMPFNRKPVGPTELDFDDVYAKLIAPAITRAGFRPVRGDEIRQPGEIIRQIAPHIAQDELVVVDITGLNPNVMYELGMRHTLRPSMTVIIRADIAPPAVPFNIGPLRVISYPADLVDVTDAIDTIVAHIDGGIQGTPDNQVFDAVRRARRAETATLDTGESFRFDFLRKGRGLAEPTTSRATTKKDASVRVVLYTGELVKHHDSDVWVNSENSFMQMARYYDQSISATIRYEGARRGRAGDPPRSDTIAEDLRRKVGRRKVVHQGAVIVTTSGRLQRTNTVKQVFHVAAAYGYPGKGYRVDHFPEACVTNVLEEFDDRRYRSMSSILFPLIGTGTAGEPVEEVAPKLIRAAVDFLDIHPDSHIRTIGFLARSRLDRDVCLNVLRRVTSLHEHDDTRPRTTGLSLSGPSSGGPASGANPGTTAETVRVQRSTVAYDDGLFRVVESDVSYRRPDGTMSDVLRRVNVDRGDSVAAVVLHTGQNAVLLSRQFRYPAAADDAFLLELPAGSLPAGEAPEAGMRRELEEELGYRVRDLRPVNSFYVSPGGSSERIHLFFAQVAETDRVSRGGGIGDEDIEIVPVPRDEVPQLLASGRVIDAKTLIGLSWLTRSGPATP